MQNRISSVESELSADSARDSVLSQEHTKQIQEMQKRIASLEAEVNAIIQDMYRTDSLREVNEVKSNLQYKDTKLKNKPIASQINELSRLAIEKVNLGMKPDEVKALLGEPRATVTYKSDLRLNYGNVWVVFEYGIVSCLVYARDFQDWATKRDYDERSMIK